jgi:hypothetical protein
MRLDRNRKNERIQRRKEVEDKTLHSHVVARGVLRPSGADGLELRIREQLFI